METLKLNVEKRNIVTLKKFFIEYNWHSLELAVEPPLYKFVYDTASVFYQKLLQKEIILLKSKTGKTTLELTNLEIMTISIMFKHCISHLNIDVEMQLYNIINKIPAHLIKYLKSPVNITEND